jgi:hypothetical protein
VHPRARIGRVGERRRRADAEVEVVLLGDRARARRRLHHHEHRRVDPGRAQRDALLHEDHAEPGRATLQRGPRDRHHAVPVPVGLDRREHLRARRFRRQHADVGADRVEVHDRLGPLR